VFYDNSIERTEIVEVPCSKSTLQALNNGDSQLNFVYNGEFLYRLGSPSTALHIRYRFRTRQGNANVRDANVSLASNFGGYLFSQATLKLGGTVIEQIRDPGVVMDVFYHCEESEFRTRDGEAVGFIPDTSADISEIIGTRTGEIAGADIAAVVASVNHANSRNVLISRTYNEGFVRRKNLLNYTVAANDDFREGDILIPLNHIFGFAAEFDRLLKYVPLEIELIRNPNSTQSVYGAPNTSVLSDNEEGIVEITLRLERVTLRPDLAVDLEQKFKNKFETYFLRRTLEEHNQINTDRTVTYVKTFGRTDEGVCRYVFTILKTAAVDSPATNYQLCSHANLQNLTVRYLGNSYPPLSQNADWARNTFSKFYADFLGVARSLGYRQPALSKFDFKNLFTVYAIDVSASPSTLNSSSLTISLERRSVPADGEATTQNPRNIRGFFVFVSECKLSIDALKRTVTKI
jgi:hypothetical protein